MITQCGTKILVVALCLLVSSCGIANLCHNTCDPGWVHGSADCGCMQVSKTSATQGTPQPALNYYVTRRFFCTDGSLCDSTVNAESCNAALDQINSQRGDHCRSCSGIIDNSRSESRWEDIQLGPCNGVWKDNRQHQASNHSWTDKLKSIMPNYSPLPRLFVANVSHLMRVAAQLPKDNTIATCREECSTGSPYCLRFKLQTRDQAGLNQLRERLGSSTSVIKSSDMLTMFSIDRDPCNRGDTVAADGYIANLGEDGACELTTQLPITDVTIQLPELLRGTFASNSAGIQVVFNDRRTRAQLHFSDPGLDADWGGHIVAVLGAQEYVNFSVGSESCIRADLK
jgi:hypothetical protein